MRAVDTNVLVRALVRDDAAQSARAEALISEHEIFIPITVMLELEWVLRSCYAYSPKVVAQALEKIAALGNAVVGERDALLAATARVMQVWDFADAIHHALSEGCDDFVTLDAMLARRGAARKSCRRSPSFNPERAISRSPAPVMGSVGRASKSTVLRTPRKTQSAIASNNLPLCSDRHRIISTEPGSDPATALANCIHLHGSPALA